MWSTCPCNQKSHYPFALNYFNEKLPFQLFPLLYLVLGEKRLVFRVMRCVAHNESHHVAVEVGLVNLKLGLIDAWGFEGPPFRILYNFGF